MEDGALELRSSNGDRRRGRLLGEELLWDDGDVWSRARSASYSWRMADWSPHAEGSGETTGPESEGWKMAPPLASQASLQPSPVVPEAPSEERRAFAVLGCGRGGDGSGEAVLDCGAARIDDTRGRRRASDRCYTC